MSAFSLGISLGTIKPKMIILLRMKQYAVLARTNQWWGGTGKGRRGNAKCSLNDPWLICAGVFPFSLEKGKHPCPGIGGTCFSTLAEL